MAGIAHFAKGGSTNSAFIRHIQTLLGVKADGVAGVQTHAAISAFQRQAGLPVTGTITPDTLKALQTPTPPLPRERPPSDSPVTPMATEIPIPDVVAPPDPSDGFVSSDKERTTPADMAELQRLRDFDAPTPIGAANPATARGINAAIGALPQGLGQFVPQSPMARMADDHPGIGVVSMRGPGAPHFNSAIDVDGSEISRAGLGTDMKIDLPGAAAKTLAGYAAGGIANAVPMPKPVHVGMIKSPTPGRTDRLPISVPKDSFILPADVVSGLNQGNSHGAGKIINAMLHPHRMKLALMGRQHRPPIAYGGQPAPLTSTGGSVSDGNDGEPVDIIAAGGEAVLPPEDVVAVGGGDMAQGHAILADFVKRVRKQTAERMLKLPGPKT